MRALRTGVVSGSATALLPQLLLRTASAVPCTVSPPRCSGCAGVTVAPAALCYGARWYATAHTSSPPPPPGFTRLSTAAEATAELQRWTQADADISTLTLSGKSLVLCATALQLQTLQQQQQQQQQQQPLSTTDTSASSSTPPSLPPPPPSQQDTAAVQRYITALAHYIYTQCNAAGKPAAPWQLLRDVETDVLRAESLQSSVHYLQHHAFGGVPVGDALAAPAAALPPPGDYEAQCAARDLALTLEAVEALLAGRHIAEIHRAAAAEEEVGSASTTAAMVPPAEAAAFYISGVVRLSSEPLSGADTSAPPSPFSQLPPVKQQYWTQAAQQLTTVLYIALLVTNTNTTDAQLVSQVFRDAVRAAYRAPAGRFGPVRSAHYLVTVALPYVFRSFSTILDVVRAQQAEAAKEATAAAKAGVEPTQNQQNQQQPVATTASAGGGSGGAKSGGAGASSDRMNKVTLVVVCVAAALYLASTQSERIFTGDKKGGAEVEETQKEKELQQTHQRLSALAASVTAATETGKR